MSWWWGIGGKGEPSVGGVDVRVTEALDRRITEAGDRRITEGADAAVGIGDPWSDGTYFTDGYGWNTPSDPP